MKNRLGAEEAHVVELGDGWSVRGTRLRSVRPAALPPFAADLERACRCCGYHVCARTVGAARFAAGDLVRVKPGAKCCAADEHICFEGVHPLDGLLVTLVAREPGGAWIADDDHETHLRECDLELERAAPPGERLELAGEGGWRAGDRVRYSTYGVWRVTAVNDDGSARCVRDDGAPGSLLPPAHLSGAYLRFSRTRRE